MKCKHNNLIGKELQGRSREGAWIEMYAVGCDKRYTVGRSREGAWIEMLITQKEGDCTRVAPARERGLK